MSVNFNIRDFFWNYPKFFSRIMKITNPLFIILLGLFFGYFLFFTLTSGFVHRFIEGRDVTKITEGVVGSLISTNPMYVTQNPVDRDFYKLVYEKFIEIDSEGLPVENIAVEWDQSSEREYVLKIKEDILWHDGENLTVDDIVWNFETSISLANEFGEDTYGSALEGVKVEKVDEFSLKFVLEETNATFWEAISVYIIPKHIYENLSLQNFSQTKTKSNPIGCGIYRVDSISKNGFTLTSFENHWETPSIEKYRYLFFEDYDELNNAVKNNEIDIIMTFDLSKIENLEEYPFFEIQESVLYNRQKVIYFNTRREKLYDDEIREALSLLVDKESLLEMTGVGGIISDGPLSSKSWAFDDSLDFLRYDPQRAEEILKSLGYVKDSREQYYITSEDEKILSVELSFLENESNTKIALALEELFKKEGVLLRLKPLNYDQVMREILPTRDFELLLYEIEVTTDPDQYNLWHSLRIDHPMLNISGYDYSRVDILLERARTNTDREERKEDYFLFQRYLIDDAPVIFLYHPKVFFVSRKNLQGFETDNIISPSDRYESVADWFWDF